MNEGAERLLLLTRSVLAGEIDVDRFCEAYEMAFNFDIDREQVADIEKFRKLFDVVAWYSPFPEERKVFPSYVDEATVLRAAQDLVKSINGDGGN